MNMTPIVSDTTHYTLCDHNETHNILPHITSSTSMPHLTLPILSVAERFALSQEFVHQPCLALDNYSVSSAPQYNSELDYSYHLISSCSGLQHIQHGISSLHDYPKGHTTDTSMFHAVSYPTELLFNYADTMRVPFFLLMDNGVLCQHFYGTTTSLTHQTIEEIKKDDETYDDSQTQLQTLHSLSLKKKVRFMPVDPACIYEYELSNDNDGIN